MISVLFTSVEGAADVAIDGYPHGDDAMHQEEFGHQLDAHEDGSPSSELDGDHCNHCCHGHSASAVAQASTTTTPVVTSEHRVCRSAYLRNLAQAPPTPPPNA